MLSRRILKRVLTLMLTLTFLVTITAACSSNQSATGSEKKAETTSKPAETKPPEQKPSVQPPSSQPQKVVAIRYIDTHTASDIRHEPIKQLVEKFNKEHPNMKVNQESLPSADLRTKLTVEMAAGNPANLSWAPVSYAREFMRDNKILDWRVVFDDPKHQEFRKWLSPKAITEYDYGDGRIIMCPNGVNMDGFFYNQEIFKKFGWELPKVWDDLISLAKKAREKGITLMVTGGKDMRFSWQISALLLRTGGVKNANALSYGPAYTEWSNPNYGFPQAMKKWKELVDAGAFPEGTLALSRDEADQVFARGEAAMYYEGQWIPGNLIKIAGQEWVEKTIRRIEFPAMPDMPNGNPKANVGGGITGLIAGANQSKEQLEVTALWAKTLVDPEFNKKTVEMGANIYAGKLDYDRSKVVTVYNQMVDAYLASEALIPSMDGHAAPVIDLTIKRDAMPGIITGKLSAEQAVAAVQKASEEYAKSLKK